MNKKEIDITELHRIISEKDFEAVEEKCYAMILDYAKDDAALLLLCQIFEADWHTRHEDMALSFQKIKNPIAAQSLFNVAFSNFDYCAWNENYPLQRKCTWALADIGTPEAKNYLVKIEQNANPIIAGFAAKRIKNWALEKPRKGAVE